MSNINGKTIFIGILIFLLLISVAFYFLYYKNLSTTHPLKKTILSLPFLKKETSQQLDETENAQKLLEEEKIRIEQEWAKIESEKKQIAEMEAQLIKKESELENLERELNIEKEKIETTLTSIKELAKYYELMDPKNAAAIMENMEDVLLIQLLRNMKKEVAAEILSNLDAKKAASITQKMSGI